MSDTMENFVSLKITRIFMKLMGMWPTNNVRDKKIANVILCYMIISMVIACMVETFDLYYSLNDIYLLSYCIPCASTVCSEIIKLMAFVRFRSEILELNSFTEVTFWKVKYKPKHMKILKACDNIVLPACLMYPILIQAVSWHYVIVPIIESSYKEIDQRKLPFNCWFTFVSCTESPSYEIIFILQTLGLFTVAMCLTTHAIFLFTINLYAAGQFQILQQNLEEVCDIVMETNIKSSHEQEYVLDIAFNILKDCIKQHQLLIEYIEKVDNLFNITILGQVFISVIQTCFSGFQILLGASDSFMRNVLSFEFAMGSILELYFFSWSSHQIIICSLCIQQAAYKCKWYAVPCKGKGKKFIQSINIIAIRSSKPCILHVGKFYPMSLVIFSQVLKSSLSYFTVLRQMNEDNNI